MTGRRLLMTADAVGGVWQYATDLAHGLAGQGWNVTIALLGPVPDDLSLPRKRAGEGGCEAQPRAGSLGTVSLLSTDLPLDWLSTSPEPVLAVGDAIAALARDLGADLVHLNSPALAARTRFPAPVVVADHGGLAPWWEAAHVTPLPAQLAWQRDLAAAGLQAANAVLAPSAAYAATVARHYGLARVEAVHNGRAAAPLPAGIRADHALTAGRLWDQVKNTATLDRAAARLSVPLRAAGPLTGPHGQMQQVAHLRYLGCLSAEALAAEYAARPVFVSAAGFEPFGLAVLEAAQAGCPLVLSDIDTFRELWDGVAQFVPDDDRAIADAVEAILAEPTRRDAMERASRARAARYSVEAMTARTAAIYARLLDLPTRATLTPARTELVGARDRMRAA